MFIDIWNTLFILVISNKKLIYLVYYNMTMWTELYLTRIKFTSMRANSKIKLIFETLYEITVTI